MILYYCCEITKIPIFNNLVELSIICCEKLLNIYNLNLSPTLKIINVSKYEKYEKYEKLDYSILTNIKQINTNVSYKKMIGKYDMFN